MTQEQCHIAAELRKMPLHAGTPKDLAVRVNRPLLNVCRDLREMQGQGAVVYAGDAYYQLQEQRPLWE